MLLVIGTSNCGKCTTTIKILESKNINYYYRKFDSYSTQEQVALLMQADTSSNKSFPILVKNDTVVKLEEVLKNANRD